MATRINKYLSEVGYCSRRVADSLIEEGKVTINGEIPEMGTKVEDGDQVEVEGQRIEKSTKHEKIYLVFNKPAGIACTTYRRVESDNIIDFIKYLFILEAILSKLPFNYLKFSYFLEKKLLTLF